MSLCNVQVEPHRALVAVDTACLSRGRLTEGSKLAVLPHMMAVLAGRGMTGFLGMVHAYYLELPADFDDTEGDLRLTLNVLRTHLITAHPVHATAFEAEIVLVGYSPSRGRMVAALCRCPAGAKEFTYQPIPWCVLGAHADLGEIPPMSSVEAMEALARRQVALFRQRDPSTAIGGRLLIATLSPKEIAIHTQCSLEEGSAPCPQPF